MPIVTIKIPDNCEVQVIQEKEREECKFKKGDVIVSEAGLMAIFEKIEPSKSIKNKNTVYYSALYYQGKLWEVNTVGYGIGYEDTYRLATDQERELFINALKKETSKGSEDAKIVLKEVFNINYSSVKTYQDLIDNNIQIEGYWTSGGDVDGWISGPACYNNTNVAKSKKVAKSMLAMAMISQLMPYYGGMITDEEWETDIAKHTIERSNNEIHCDLWKKSYYFLAFHTAEQRDEFLKYNEQLVKNYLMLD